MSRRSDLTRTVTLTLSIYIKTAFTESLLLHKGLTAPKRGGSYIEINSVVSVLDHADVILDVFIKKRMSVHKCSTIMS